MGKKSKSKTKKKAGASPPAQAPAPAVQPTSRPAPARASQPAKAVGGAGTSSSKPTQKERDDARIERAARQFAPKNPALEISVDHPIGGAPGWYPDRDSVLETALSDKHADILSQMLVHDEKVSWCGTTPWLMPPFNNRLLIIINAYTNIELIQPNNRWSRSWTSWTRCTPRETMPRALGWPPRPLRPTRTLSAAFTVHLLPVSYILFAFNLLLSDGLILSHTF